MKLIAKRRDEWIILNAIIVFESSSDCWDRQVTVISQGKSATNGLLWTDKYETLFTHRKIEQRLVDKSQLTMTSHSGTVSLSLTRRVFRPRSRMFRAPGSVRWAAEGWSSSPARGRARWRMRIAPSLAKYRRAGPPSVRSRTSCSVAVRASSAAGSRSASMAIPTRRTARTRPSRLSSPRRRRRSSHWDWAGTVTRCTFFTDYRDLHGLIAVWRLSDNLKKRNVKQIIISKGWSFVRILRRKNRGTICDLYKKL